MSITFIHGDCLEKMRDLPDKSVDCFVCDLPYGTINCAWDVKIDLAAFWVQVKRLAKNDHTPVLMFCTTKFGNDLINSNPSWFRCDLVWDKGHGISFLLANKMPMKSHEMVYVFSKKGTYYKRVDIKTDRGDWKIDRRSETRMKSTQYGVKTSANPDGVEYGGKDGMRCPLSVIPIAGKLAGGHPTQKPKELYRWLLERYCPDGGTILDPTAGSFNSCFVAQEMGLNAIGIEKDDTFFKKACPDIISHVE